MPGKAFPSCPAGPTPPPIVPTAVICRVDAAQLPLCLATPEMHNRRLVNQTFAQASAAVAPVMETNLVLTWQGHSFVGAAGGAGGLGRFTDQTAAP